MSRLIQHETVRVRQILFPEQDYDGWRVNQRKPQVGDKGTLVEIIKSDNMPLRYVVESSGPDGSTVFLSEFDDEEIEPVNASLAD